MEESNEQVRNVFNDIENTEVQQNHIDFRAVLEGDLIYIDKDGNVVAKGNAKYNSKLLDSSKNSKKGVDKSKVVEKIKADKSKEIKAEKEDKKSVSEPSWKGMTGMIIGVVIVGGVIAIWLGVYPKFKNK